MTADEFQMMHITFLDRGEWRIRIRDGDVRIQADVYDETFQECIADNFEYISDTVANYIVERVNGELDKCEITEEEKGIFLTILGKVIQ